MIAIWCGVGDRDFFHGCFGMHEHVLARGRDECALRIDIIAYVQ